MKPMFLSLVFLLAACGDEDSKGATYLAPPALIELSFADGTAATGECRLATLVPTPDDASLGCVAAVSLLTDGCAGIQPDGAFASIDAGVASQNSFESVSWSATSPDASAAALTHGWTGVMRVDSFVDGRLEISLEDGEICPFDDTSGCWATTGTLVIDVVTDDHDPAEAADYLGWVDVATGQPLCGAGDF